MQSCSGHLNSSMDCSIFVRRTDIYTYTLCAPGTRRFIPNVVLHQHKIAFCAPICAPSTNAVRWTCPAHTPFIPYWPQLTCTRYKVSSLEPEILGKNGHCIQQTTTMQECCFLCTPQILAQIYGFCIMLKNHKGTNE